MDSAADTDEQASTLVSRLSRAGIDIDTEALLSLIDGVNASPLAIDDKAWTLLLGSRLDTGTRKALIALRVTRREEQAKAGVDGADAAARLTLLRARLEALGVDGLILPRADEHQGEYLPPRAERLAWLTGFIGSAGVVVVLKDKAAVFTDGRYTLAIREQVDPSLYETRHVITEPPTEWIEEHLGEAG
ncbi:MAG: aminopeptidase P family N-terminal domain-containing protein, partial [Alphaproteobacteria bacterium]|nr:aminopeptidase P family N-terminal domain-containing protein [Alphaproteobacteria bacterium]